MSESQTIGPAAFVNIRDSSKEALSGQELIDHGVSFFMWRGSQKQKHFNWNGQSNTEEKRAYQDPREELQRSNIFFLAGRSNNGQAMPHFTPTFNRTRFSFYVSLVFFFGLFVLKTSHSIGTWTNEKYCSLCPKTSNPLPQVSWCLSFSNIFLRVCFKG